MEQVVPMLVDALTSSTGKQAVIDALYTVALGESTSSRKRFHESTSSRGTMSADTGTQTGSLSGSNGVYKGKFTRKRGKRVRRVMKKKPSKKRRRSIKKKKKRPVDFKHFGVQQTIEEFGTANDNDTVYIMTPCCNDSLVIKTLVMSLVKKLLAQGIRWYAPSVTEEIIWGPGAGTIDPASLFINLYGGDPAGTDAQYTVLQNYAFANNDTVETVANQFTAAFKAYSAGLGFSNPNTEMHSMVLGCSVRNAADTSFQNIVLSTLYMETEVVHWKGSSRVKIQNRTNSVTNSGLTDVNDSKPLEGYMYSLNGLPRLRVPSSGDFASISSDRNTKTWGAGTAPNDFKEPPPSSVFLNCRGRTRIRLDPGQIKEHSVYGSGSMDLLKFLKKINAQDSGTGAFLSTHTLFKTLLFGFEEVINSTDTNAVTIGFENSVNCSVTFTTKMKKTATIPLYNVVAITETA